MNKAETVYIAIVIALIACLLSFGAGQTYQQDIQSRSPALIANNDLQFELGNRQVYALVCKSGEMTIAGHVQPILIVCDGDGDESAIVYVSK